MNELVMRTRWARGAQMIFMATALFGSTACNQISQVDDIMFTGPETAGDSFTGERTELRCKTNEMMVAVSVHRGSWIESIGVNCAAYNKVDGALGTPAPSLLEKDPAQQDYSVPCEDRQVVVALRARHDSTTPSFIRQISVGCATVSGRKSSAEPVYSAYTELRNPTESDHAPLPCDEHQVAAGMSVWMDEGHVTNYSLHCSLPT